MLSNKLCSTSYDGLICKYRELFSIVNSGFSIDRATKMAVSLSPTAYTTYVQVCKYHY